MGINKSWVVRPDFGKGGRREEVLDSDFDLHFAHRSLTEQILVVHSLGCLTLLNPRPFGSGHPPIPSPLPDFPVDLVLTRLPLPPQTTRDPASACS